MRKIKRGTYFMWVDVEGTVVYKITGVLKNPDRIRFEILYNDTGDSLSNEDDMWKLHGGIKKGYARFISEDKAMAWLI